MKRAGPTAFLPIFAGFPSLRGPLSSVVQHPTPQGPLTLLGAYADLHGPPACVRGSHASATAPEPVSDRPSGAAVDVPRSLRRRPSGTAPAAAPATPAGRRVVPTAPTAAARHRTAAGVPVVVPAAHARVTGHPPAGAVPPALAEAAAATAVAALRRRDHQGRDHHTDHEEDHKTHRRPTLLSVPRSEAPAPPAAVSPARSERRRRCPTGRPCP